MSSQEAVHVSLIKVMPRSGKETLGAWWFHFQRGGRTHRAAEAFTSELNMLRCLRMYRIC